MATVVTAPLAGLGPAVYGCLTLLQALAEDPAVEQQPDGRRSAGTGLVGLSFVLAADAAGLRLGSDALLWGVLFGSSGAQPLLVGRPARPHGPADRDGPYGFGPPPLAHRVGRRHRRGRALQRDPRRRRGRDCWRFSWPPPLASHLAGPRGRADRAGPGHGALRQKLAGMVHDSVPQTLALIQSRADDPAEVKALARRQERDLREQVFGDSGPTRPTRWPLRSVPWRLRWRTRIG